MNDNLLSVIVPVYNREVFLEQCLDSIINQSYSNLDIIIVDDGSSDLSREIIKSYAEKDKRVTYFFQSNKGVSAARNLGISKSKGQYITFVDSDDWIDSTMYEVMMKKINTIDSDSAICSYVREYLEKKEYEILPFEKKDVLESEDIYRDVVLNLISSENEAASPLMGSTCRCIFSKDIIIKNNILFNEKLSCCEDLLFCLTYFTLCKKVSVISEHFYHYRFNENSAIVKYDSELWDKHLMVHEEINKKFNKDNTEISKRISRRFILCSINSMINIFHKDNKSNIIKKYLSIKKIHKDIRRYIISSSYTIESTKYKILKFNASIIVFIALWIKSK